MEANKISGILSIILGLIFIIFPIFSSGVVSIIIGISLLFFGIALVLAGFTASNIIIGILAGILGLFSDTQTSKLASVLMIILGIVSFILGGFSLGQPLFAAILIGVALIIQGIRLYLE